MPGDGQERGKRCPARARACVCVCARARDERRKITGLHEISCEGVTENRGKLRASVPRLAVPQFGVINRAGPPLYPPSCVIYTYKAHSGGSLAGLQAGGRGRGRVNGARTRQREASRARLSLQSPSDFLVHRRDRPASPNDAKSRKIANFHTRV